MVGGTVKTIPSTGDSNSDAFQSLCLHLLWRTWRCPGIDRDTLFLTGPSLLSRGTLVIVWDRKPNLDQKRSTHTRELLATRQTRLFHNGPTFNQTLLDRAIGVVPYLSLLSYAVCINPNFVRFKWLRN